MIVRKNKNSLSQKSVHMPSMQFWTKEENRISAALWEQWSTEQWKGHIHETKTPCIFGLITGLEMKGMVGAVTDASIPHMTIIYINYCKHPALNNELQCSYCGKALSFQGGECLFLTLIMITWLSTWAKLLFNQDKLLFPKQAS